VKAFDKFKETNCLKYYTAKNSQFILKKYNRNLLWKQNESKDKQSSEEHTIKHGVRHGCPLPPTPFNIYMNVRMVK
jgi:hypothetical protein